MRCLEICSKSKASKHQDLSNNLLAVKRANRELILLFHGSDLNACAGILNEGFRPSPKGLYGSGVYFTASPSTAYVYSVTKTLMYCNSVQYSDDEKLTNEVLLDK